METLRRARFFFDDHMYTIEYTLETDTMEPTEDFRVIRISDREEVDIEGEIGMYIAEAVHDDIKSCMEERGEWRARDYA